MVKLKDIAEKAGVSLSAVSRVLNKRDSLVGEKTKQKVLKIAKEMNYTPNHFASSLKRGSTNMIGVSLSGRQTLYFTNPYLAKVMDGIARTLPEENFRMVLHLLDASSSQVDQSHDLISSRVVDGMIYILTGIHYNEFMNITLPHLQALQSPFIVVHSSGTALPCPSVGLDCTAAGRLAAEYLKKKGYRTFGIVDRPKAPNFMKEQVKGFTETVGAEAITHTYDEFGYTWSMGTRLAARILENRNDLPDAIFVPEESMAGGLVTGFKEAGLTLPDDIAVIAFGDCIEPQRYMPLTTIHQPAGEKGKKAAVHLIGSIREPEKADPSWFHCFTPEIVPGTTA